MNDLQSYIQKYVERINDSTFKLKAINLKEFDEIKRHVIDYKLKIINDSKGITLNDLALVRITNLSGFPRMLEYHTLQEDGIMGKLENPLNSLMGYISMIEEFKDFNVGCNRKEIELSKLDIIYPVFRNTKHFTLNGLSSNVESIFGSLAKFNNKEIILIEPFISHLDDDLVNLNPVDTFYDLSKGPFKLSDKTVFVIDTETYKKMINDPQIKDDLSRVKVFLYDPVNTELTKRYNANLQTVMTDIALSYLGYVPQHSVGQTHLEKEFYFKDIDVIDDTSYLQLFQNYMEFLNRKLLNQSYYEVAEDKKENRKAHAESLLGSDLSPDAPGKLHSETKYYKEEKRMNLHSIINTLWDYLEFLVTELGLEQDLAEWLFYTYSSHIRKNYDHYLVTIYSTLEKEKEILSFIERVGYYKLVEATEKFNNSIREKTIPGRGKQN